MRWTMQPTRATTKSQHASRVIAALQLIAITFVMHAMVGRLSSQLKMPRLDAYQIQASKSAGPLRYFIGAQKKWSSAFGPSSVCACDHHAPVYGNLALVQHLHLNMPSRHPPGSFRLLLCRHIDHV